MILSLDACIYTASLLRCTWEEQALMHAWIYLSLAQKMSRKIDNIWDKYKIDHISDWHWFLNKNML